MDNLACACRTDILTLVCKKPPVGNKPNTPAAPMGISNGGRNTSYEFLATTTDPDNDSIRFRFQWDDNAASDWSNWVASGETAALWHTWSDQGIYQVKAQAQDQPGLLSGWSMALQVTIIATSAPNTPGTPTGPDSTRKDSLCTFTTIATDPDGDGVSYRFDWGDGDTSAWTELVASGSGAGTYHVWNDTGTFQVAVQAQDEDAAVSDWSVVCSMAVWRPKWRYRTGGQIWSSPAVADDGTVYVGSNDTYLYAVNPSGTLKWRYQTGGQVNSSPAIAADGTVYVGSLDNYLYAINPDGSVRWRYQTGDDIWTSPAIAADGTVYVGSLDNLYAISPSGSLKWRDEIGYNSVSSPAVASDGTVYLGTSQPGYTYAIDPDGTIKWRYAVEPNVQTSPVVAADGTIYVGSNRYLNALNPNGTLKWRYETGSAVQSSPAVAEDGTVYVGSWDHCLHAINPDGTPKWRHETDHIVTSSPAVAADGTVYVGSADGYLYATNPDGTLRWRHATRAGVYSSPAIAGDGAVYVGSDDGCLYAIQGDSPLANSAWPKFHHDNKNTGRVGGGR
ncbi:MAG: PQQ-binding-like beta-propeller repeat protein [candidate division WOR-3 bacterium]